MKRALWVLLVGSALTASALWSTTPKPWHSTPGVASMLLETSSSSSLMTDESAVKVDRFTALHLDLNERQPEIAETYVSARNFVRQGKWQDAQALLDASLHKFPDSRHLLQVRAELLWSLYKDQNEKAVLPLAKADVLRAYNIGFDNGALDDKTIWLLAEILVESKDRRTLDDVFSKLLPHQLKNPNAYLYYAQALAKFDDPHADDMFREALRLDENVAQTSYAEWLLDHGRTADTLSLIPASATDYYLHFLRGVALERLGRPAEAQVEYQQFAEFSKVFPAPRRFKIDSELQRKSGIQFEEQSPLTDSRERGFSFDKATDTSAIAGLAQLITGEAPSESAGGKRAVGWLVRNRALRGALQVNGASSYCPGAYNSGTTLADKYISVMCAGIGTSGEQFNGMCDQWCSNPNTSACPTLASGASASANNVYYGTEPDPVSGHCPGGSTAGSGYCSDTITCFGDTDSYRLAGPVFNYGTSGSCPTSSSCFALTTLAGKVCSNGVSDNCFYKNQVYGTGSYSIYSGTISSTSTASISSTIVVSGSGTFQAHL